MLANKPEITHQLLEVPDVNVNAVCSLQRPDGAQFEWSIVHEVCRFVLMTSVLIDEIIPPGAQIFSFDFMQFSGKVGKIGPPPPPGGGNPESATEYLSLVPISFSAGKLSSFSTFDRSQ